MHVHILVFKKLGNFLYCAFKPKSSQKKVLKENKHKGHYLQPM